METALLPRADSPISARIALPPLCWQPRYAMVDGWRGLAALGVVSYHLGLPQWGEFDLGHACVMMFFVISGYCIAASCESCRVHKISPAAYMWRRFVAFIRHIYFRFVSLPSRAS